MRLLMLNNEFPPLGGGTGTVNLALLQRWARVPALEIDLVTSALGTQFEQEQFAERIRIFKVPVNNRNIHHSVQPGTADLCGAGAVLCAAAAPPAALRFLLCLERGAGRWRGAGAAPAGRAALSGAGVRPGYSRLRAALRTTVPAANTCDSRYLARRLKQWWQSARAKQT